MVYRLRSGPPKRSPPLYEAPNSVADVDKVISQLLNNCGALAWLDVLVVQRNDEALVSLHNHASTSAQLAVGRTARLVPQELVLGVGEDDSGAAVVRVESANHQYTAQYQYSVASEMRYADASMADSCTSIFQQESTLEGPTN